ncbi:MAG: S1C family serine protease [Eubacteriales bacterium]|nr:S1C family serine protease [Eubacteriales bacterium]
MPEVRGPEKEQEKKEQRRFINEKVVRQPLTGRQLARRGLLLICAAVLFGAAAAVGFAAAFPAAERYFGDRSEAESQISIPKDEPAESSSAPAEEQTQASETESEPIREQVQSVIENYRYTLEDFTSMISSLRAQAVASDKGIVTVHSVQQEVDWFDNPVETTGLYSGAVIANTGREILILTPEAAVENADSIKVAFSGGKDVGGRIKQKDRVSGMAIVSVDTADVEETILKAVAVVPLGNSYTLREGDILIALGSPAGIVHSMDYGVVSYVLKGALRPDQNCRVIYSDVMADAGMGTFLLNTSGELVGWATETAGGQEKKTPAVTEIMGISDYKSILERMSNGLGVPYVGIAGQTVTEAMAGRGLPGGVYVVSAVADSPAYSAGIQNGDIITAIDGQEVLSMKDYQSITEKLACGQTISVAVSRNGRESYASLEFQITVGER